MPFALGLLTLRHNVAISNPSGWQFRLGLWLLGIAANYVPLFLHAVAIARSGTVQAEGAPERARARR